jgi:HK97 family phage prohead protease
MTAAALSLRPATLDRTARTVEAVASTGAPVARRDARGPYTEVLDLAGADLSRLVGAPVLDAHRQGSRRDVLGSVVAARIEDGALIVLLQVTERADGDEVLADIEAGHLRGVSLGYTVASWREERAENGARVMVAAAWTPIELSLVPIPADPGATVRQAMPEPTAAAPAETTTRTRAEESAEVRALAQIAGLAAPWAGEMAEPAEGDDAPDPAAERAAALDALRRRSATPLRTTRATVGMDHDDPAVRSARIGEALYARANPAHQLAPEARQFYGLTMPEIGRDILRRAGVSTTGLSAAAVITRALHTTSDFSLILGDTVGRTLRASYAAAPAGVKALAKATTARDFRAKRRLQLGEAPLPEPVGENGEFKSGTMAEAEETYAVGTFGRIIGVSRQAIINDDLGAFTDLSGRLGVACAEFEAKFLTDLLVQGSGLGPTMADGKRLFHADHGNIGTVGAPSMTTLSEARRLMRRQTGLSGQPISVTPRFVLVPPELETAAEAVLATLAPARLDDVNVFSGKFQLVVEPRLASATRWYVTAAASEIDGLEYAYLEGAPGPQIESRNGFEVDGVQIKVRLDFGAGFVDWRGWLTNAGA